MKTAPAPQTKTIAPPRPTPGQAQWQDHELGMFIHFDLNVFMPPGWDHRHYGDWPEPSLFNPVKLDTDQWMEAARAFGAKYAVLTATHGTGFMLWQSDAYPFGVRQSPWRGGRGDVVKDFAASCRRCGIQPGLYSHMCCNGYWKVDHPGLVNEGLGGDPKKQAEYARARAKSLHELWGNYGPMGEIWFDGGVPDKSISGFDAVGILKKHQPDAMIFQGPAATIRWIGNESGVAPYPCWATVSDEKTAKTGEGALPASGDPDGNAWLPGECDVAIRNNTWMWEPDTEDRLFSLDHLMDMYEKSVGRNCNLLLNANPNRDGLIPDADMRRYREFGTGIERRFGEVLSETSGKGKTVELDLKKPAVIDRLIIMEQIAQGERIREYAVAGWMKDQWHPLCRGQSVGHKRIERFDPVEVSKVRLSVAKSAAEPLIRKLAVFRAGGNTRVRNAPA